MAWHSGKPILDDTVAQATQYVRENFAELEPLQPHVAKIIALAALQPKIVDLMDLHPHIAEIVDLMDLHPHIVALVDLTTLQPHIAKIVDLTTLQPHVAALVDLTALHPHVAALLDSRIVDHNLDTPGPDYYVRWANGMQLCFGRLTPGTYNINSTFGGLFISAAFTANLAAEFANVLAVSTGMTTASPGGPYWPASHSITTTEIKFNVYSAVSVTNATSQIGYIVWGTWSA